MTAEDEMRDILQKIQKEANFNMEVLEAMPPQVKETFIRINYMALEALILIQK